jgi:hypothetical protein
MSVLKLINDLALQAGEQLASGDVARARRTLQWRAKVRDEAPTYAEFVAQCDAHVEWLAAKAAVTR